VAIETRLLTTDKQRKLLVRSVCPMTGVLRDFKDGDVDFLAPHCHYLEEVVRLENILFKRHWVCPV
jgi:hypothetical protein